MKDSMIQAIMSFVFDENYNLLVLKRTDNGLWEPVKGGIEKGEGWLEATLREVHEETQLNIKNNPILIDNILDVLDTSKSKNTKISGFISYSQVTGIKPDPILESGNPPEHSDYNWLNLEEILNFNFYPPIANKYKSKIYTMINSPN